MSEVTKIVPVGPIGEPKTPCECLADIAKLMDDLADLDGVDDSNVLTKIARDNENRKLGCPVIYGHGTHMLENATEIAKRRESKIQQVAGTGYQLRREEEAVKTLLPMEWLTSIILSVEGEGSSLTMEDDEEREEVVEDIQEQPYLWMASDNIPVECINKMMAIFQLEEDTHTFGTYSIDDLEVADRRRRRLMEEVDNFFDYCESAKPVLPTLEGIDRELDIEDAVMEHRSELEVLVSDLEELSSLRVFGGEFDKDKGIDVYTWKLEGGDSITYTLPELNNAIVDYNVEIKNLSNMEDEYVQKMDGLESRYLSGLKIMVEMAMWPNCKNLRWKR